MSTHEHVWTRHQNVTSRGDKMPPYEACECGAARRVADVPEPVGERLANLCCGHVACQREVRRLVEQARAGESGEGVLRERIEAAWVYQMRAALMAAYAHKGYREARAATDRMVQVALKDARAGEGACCDVPHVPEPDYRDEADAIGNSTGLGEVTGG